MNLQIHDDLQNQLRHFAKSHNPTHPQISFRVLAERAEGLRAANLNSRGSIVYIEPLAVYFEVMSIMPEPDGVCEISGREVDGDGKPAPATVRGSDPHSSFILTS